ncbi:TetR/AcrR family transcriptional regulator [Gordonia sp. CPCC 206044]|uniref:TetR/AcrR family transcriptional regulator n=1 Tax=Gordonia sp. CPCC 206044 TaxID=3140793 RepID=UPI003AF3CF98
MASDGNSVPRRVAWGAQGPPEDPRDHIVEAAIRSLAQHGLERTSLTVIAREAQVSRQTVYKYFSTKEEIVEIAIEKEASEASRRLTEAALANSTAAGFVVDLCLTALDEFNKNPAISPMVTVLGQPDARGRLLTPDVMALVQGFLQPLETYRPDRVEYMDEMTETFLRFVVSLMTFRGPSAQSNESLRGYVTRVLVPAMGLSE